MESKIFSIGEVCNLLDLKSHNLRYLEKALNLSPERDKSFNRVYTETDVKELKRVINLKKSGLNYDAIKKILNDEKDIDIKSVECACTITEENIQENYDLIPFDKVEVLKKLMKTVINESLTENLNPKLEELSNDNKVLKDIIERQQKTYLKTQEMHFKDIDNKFIKWREDNFKSEKKSFFKTLFKKR
ncbi:helix-turn-helix domain-containing protein [Clostridium hydrogeniformans]|uniref:helix-turn-helix domain-containing protein n=1 Tax=Clostridium hydrogeniformans TaxID=349933 RepID=UPI00068AF87C|nr:helix-turn-helix domain-containing protein [Clostridium hydrogeniformans]